MMRIMVTGGLGFIGSHTVIELIDQGYEVIVIDNLSNTKINVLKRIEMITGKKPTFYTADTTNIKIMRKIFLDNRIDGIIHFAGFKAVAESIKKPLEYYYNNLVSTITLGKLCEEFKVKKFVFSSSATVYGDQVSPVSEYMPLQKRINPYGETKATNEKILSDFSSTDQTLEITILRYFNPIGAHKSGLLGENPLNTPSNIMPLIIKVATGDIEKLEIFGDDYNTPDGTAIRDYIHVVDLAKGHIKAIENGNKGFNIYNLGTGHGTTVLELINTFIDVNEVYVPFEVTDRRMGDIEISYADISKAKNELHWAPIFKISDMVRDSWNYSMKEIMMNLKRSKQLSDNIIKKYIEWTHNINPKDKRDLLKMRKDIDGIKENFYKNLNFGTGGLREKIDLGSNRINIYTIAKATQGLANYITELNVETPKVLIAFDTRKKSKIFAKTAASVLAANNIYAIIFKESRPTPELSFGIRKLSCDFGIVITASHNPPEYNGYKIYEKNGVQIVPLIANEIIKAIEKVHIFKDIRKIDYKKAMNENKITEILDVVDESYYSYIKNNLLNRSVLINSNVRFLYTALYGTGAVPISTICQSLKLMNYSEVKEEMVPDSSFGSLIAPNPELPDVFKNAKVIAEHLKSDIILATDPDCDRVGLLVRHEDSFRSITGNQIGILLLYYILENRSINDKKTFFIKTIVTSELSEKIALNHGIQVVNTLTGFKYIGEKICDVENKGNKFLFAYEESNGYLYGNDVRDKDGVMATLLIMEMTAYYGAKGLTLIQVLKKIYLKYGFYKEDLRTIKFDGRVGQKKILKIMEYFREEKIYLKSFEISQVIDYRNSIDGLPKANVLKFLLKDNGWFIIRPSGTEPKVKLYFSMNSKNQDLLEKKLNLLIAEVTDIVEMI